MKKNLISMALLASILFIASCDSSKTEVAKNVHKIDIEKVLNAFTTGNTDGLDAIIDANYVEHTPPPGMEVKGLEGFKNLIKMNHDAFPDVKFEIKNYVEDGDLVMFQYNWKGTNTGDMGPSMPATNKPSDFDGVDILKFSNGKCTDHWGYFEEMKMMTQLGLMPEMGGEAPSDSSAKSK